MHIVRAKPEDTAILTHIAVAAKRHWGYPETWMESWRGLLTIRPEFIASHEIYSAVIDGQSVGLYGLFCRGRKFHLERPWGLLAAVRGGLGLRHFVHACK